MKLLLDLGNSALKWTTRDHRGLGQPQAQPINSGPPAAWRDLPEPTTIGLSSVASATNTQRVIQWCRQYWNCPLQRLQAQATAAGVHNAYPQPQDLGSDRWMALIAAHQLCPGTKCIVDAGSALTIDLLTAQGHHQGGHISPGYRAMLSSLLTHTDLRQPEDNHAYSTLPGRNTRDGIRSGIYNALLGLIKSAHRDFDNGHSQLILTGGNAPMLLPQLPDSTQHIPELVLIGIDILLQTTAVAPATTQSAPAKDPSS